MKKNKKRKKSFRKVLLFLIFLIILISSFYSLFTHRIQYINIKGNNYLKEEEIIDIANLGKYPNFIFTLSLNVKKDLKKHPLIKEVHVRKKLFYEVEIDVQEENILFYDLSHNNYILENGKTYHKDNRLYDVPVLINYTIQDVLKPFKKKFKDLDLSMRNRISEIKYNPSEYDKTRFLMTMNDGNYVYINIPNLKKINYYDNIVMALNGKKGILYLDSNYGNASQFVILS